MFDFDGLADGEEDEDSPEVVEQPVANQLFSKAPVVEEPLIWDEKYVQPGTSGHLRGYCLGCRRCMGWTARQGSWNHQGEKEFVASTVEARRYVLPSLCGAMPVFDGKDFLNVRPKWGTSSSSSVKAGPVPCGRCGCPEKNHEVLTERLGRFSERRIPLEALGWREVEVALWGDTDGAFRPEFEDRVVARGRARQLSAVNSLVGTSGPTPLVSVICPTTPSRRCFHRFLWYCFEEQDYSPRELVVIDTGEGGPSEFFTEKAETDPRIVYKHYAVPESRWSIGLKRNLACYYASGDIIAHFDDDDVYAPCYLTCMVWCLRDPQLLVEENLKDLRDSALLPEVCSSMNMKYTELGLVQKPVPQEAENRLQQVLGDFPAACAKLCSWHTFSLHQRTWAFFQASEGKRHQLYGWGFSLIYLRSAWEACPFLHINLGEDLDFVLSLRELSLPVVLARDSRGVVVHTQHKASTSGECRRTGGKVPRSLLYGPLVAMLPLYEWSTLALGVHEIDPEQQPPPEPPQRPVQHGTATAVQLPDWAQPAVAAPQAPQAATTFQLPDWAQPAPAAAPPAAAAPPPAAAAAPPQASPARLPDWTAEASAAQQPTDWAEVPLTAPQDKPQPDSFQQLESKAQVSSRGDRRTGHIGLYRQQAVALQDELLDAYSANDFQRRLHRAWAAYDKPTRKEARRREVCLEVQGPVIARYGFEKSSKGMFAVAMELDADFGYDQEVALKARICHWLTQPEYKVWQEFGKRLPLVFADKSPAVLAIVFGEVQRRVEARRRQ